MSETFNQSRHPSLSVTVYDPHFRNLFILLIHHNPISLAHVQRARSSVDNFLWERSPAPNISPKIDHVNQIKRSLS